MKLDIRRPRILILSLLFVSFLAPIVYFSTTPLDFSHHLGRKELLDETSRIFKFSPIQTHNALNVNSVRQELSEGLTVPEGIVLELGKDLENSISDSIENKTTLGSADAKLDDGATGGKVQTNESVQLQHLSINSSWQREGFQNQITRGQSNSQLQSKPPTDQKVREMEDMLIMAKAYLQYAPSSSNSHLVKELRLRIKEVERVLGHASKDSDISRSGLHKLRAMEASLVKAHKAYPDCSAMASKLRAMTYNTEEQLRAQQNQASYLIQLAARTFPKGLHCLTMRLTTDYFSLQPEERNLPNADKERDANLYHYGIFSDNVLACAVVVNSTVTTSLEPGKIVFHVVTDSLNFPAMTMWFLMNPPGQATIHIKNMDDFKWLPSGFSLLYKQRGVQDLRFTSALNHLRFYLPDIFPYLNKILFLDHDVVVQRDLAGLWAIDMKGNVNLAVEKCRKGDPSHRLGSLVDFSDPTIMAKFDDKSCLWAYGMNMFYLDEWRRQGLTQAYQKLLHLGKGRQRQPYKAGSMPIGQLTFYNHTVALGKRWHLLGLGHDLNVGRTDIERAAVIHYDGNMKPWLEIGIPKYRSYWMKFLSYNLPYLQQCNIHE